MQVVYGGIEGFDALMYGEQSQNNTNFFANQLQQITTPLVQVGNDFIERAKSIYNTFNGSYAMQAAKTALRAIQGIFIRDQVQLLSTLPRLQLAPPVMQRYIMANPMVREMYHRQEIDGYSDTYRDNEPGRIGEDHYDYRRVMDGVIKFDSTEEDVDWTYTHYIDEDRPDEPELLGCEKADIIDTWSIIESYLQERNSDPTSVWNSPM